MFEILREIQVLRDEGKLHKRLLVRIRMLFIISLILTGIVVFNVIARGANIAIVAALIVAGFLLGLFVFSRMNVVQWNEEESVVQTGRIDTIGFIALGLYIVFEIGLRTFLRDFFPASATAFIFAGVLGTLAGRAVGTIVEIHRVYRSSHELS